MKNKINDTTLSKLYNNYATMSLSEFRHYCLELVTNSRQKNMQIIHKIPNMRTKDQLLQAVNNFAMKGHGYGVIP